MALNWGPVLHMPGALRVYTLDELTAVDLSNRYNNAYRLIHDKARKLINNTGTLVGSYYKSWEQAHVQHGMQVVKGHWHHYLFSIAGHLIDTYCSVCGRLARDLPSNSQIDLPRPLQDEKEDEGSSVIVQRQKAARGRPAINADGEIVFDLDEWLNVNRKNMYKKEFDLKKATPMLRCLLCDVCFMRRSTGGVYFIQRHEGSDQHTAAIASQEGRGKRLCVRTHITDCNGFILEDLKAAWWPGNLYLTVTEVLICL